MSFKIPYTNIEIGKTSGSAINADRDKEIQEQAYAEYKSDMPVSGGRSSVPEGQESLMSMLMAEFSSIQPDYEMKLVDVIEQLAKYNADLSYALDNIVQLGNTEWTVHFGDTIKEETAGEMVKHLKDQGKTWYSHSGGLNSFINDSFAQLALTGALSAEAVPQKDLKGVKKCVMVTPQNIRFIYDPEADEYIAHQKVPHATGEFVQSGGLKRLNPRTYQYIAMRRFNEKPYAIPPFLSALESISIEKDMVHNLRHIVKQIGLFGFLQVLMSAPSRKQGETDSAYKTKCLKHLQDQTPEIEKSLAKGFVMGYKDKHEFEMKGKLADAKGAELLFDLNNKIKMSGLKQDPLMLGRNYSTTESLGRVILAKLTNQITNYQSSVASFLEFVFKMELNLAGFKVDNLDVEFEKPMLGDRMKDEQAYNIKINNAKALYNQGILDHQGVAQYLGYEKPAENEPLLLTDDTDIDNENDQDSGGNRTRPDTDETNTESNTVERHDVERAALRLRADVPSYDYGGTRNELSCGCKVSFAQVIDEGDDETRRYWEQTRAVYAAAAKKASSDIAKALSELGQGATLQRVQDVVLYNLYKNWNGNFSRKQRKIIERWISAAYTKYRNATNVFANMDPNNIPEAVFNTPDYRTMEYFRRSDDLYMGKFITDADTRQRMTKWMQEQYSEGQLPIGKNAKVIEKFREEFANVLEGEDWKLQRIISTTVQKMRNYAAVTYMEQAEVTEFEIRGINDHLQCGYCSWMQGKTFAVQTAVNTIKDVTATEPEYVGVNAPFITALYKKPEDLEGVATETLQSQGIDTPPFHSHCRDTVVARV